MQEKFNRKQVIVYIAVLFAWTLAETDVSIPKHDDSWHTKH